MNNIIISIILSINVIIIIYFSLEFLSLIKFKSIKKGIKQLLNKTSYLNCIENTLNYINKVYSFSTTLINKLNVFILSLIIAIISFILFFLKFKLLLGSSIIFLISFFIPLSIIELIKMGIKYQIKQAFSLYVIGIQSFATNSNDVIMAINNVKPIKPLDKYISNFNILINNGFDIIKAFNILITEIDIKEVSKFFNLLKLCYINGGNLKRVVNQYYDFLVQINKISKKQNEKRNYYLSILGVILVINIFLVFVVVLNNAEYKQILLNTILGKALLNINILAYFLIFLMFKKGGLIWNYY